MINQYELIEESRRLSCPLTTQTLRNYIKAGLCHGAINTNNGIEARGVLPVYPIVTLPEALTAKTMMEVKGRKLDKIVVILAKVLGSYILKNEPGIIKQNSDDIFKAITANLSPNIGTFSLTEDIITWTKFNRQDIMAIMTGRGTTVSKGKDYSIRSIIALSAEWVTLFANYCNSDFRRLREKYPNIPYLITIRNVLLTDFSGIYVGQHSYHDYYLFSNNSDDLLSRERKLNNLKIYLADKELQSNEATTSLFSMEEFVSLFEDLAVLPEIIRFSYKNLT